MSEVPPSSVGEAVERTRLDAASAARLRTLVRPGFSAREFATSVSRIEIAALVGLVLLVVSTVLVYSWVILPDQVEAVQLRGEVTVNRTKIEELQRRIDDPTEMTRQFDEVQASLDTFRGAMLKPRLAGRLAIIDTIGRLSNETGARMSSSVAFATRDPRAEAAVDATKRRNVRGGDKSDNGKVKSYPSLEVTFGLTGSYEQLRRFIGRIEASDQFVVIESVSLSANETRGAARGARRAQSAGAVTLEIVMTAFFQAETPVGIQ